MILLNGFFAIEVDFLDMNLFCLLHSSNVESILGCHLFPRNNRAHGYLFIYHSHLIAHSQVLHMVIMNENLLGLVSALFVNLSPLSELSHSLGHLLIDIMRLMLVQPSCLSLL